MENEKLNQLQKLFEDGLITEDELKKKREKIISEMINQDSVTNTNQSLKTKRTKKQHKARKVILSCITILFGICLLGIIFNDEDEQSISAEKTVISKSDDKKLSKNKDSQKNKSESKKTKQKANDITKYEALDIAEYLYGKENIVASWSSDSEKKYFKYNGQKGYSYDGYLSYCLVKLSESFYGIIYTQKWEDGTVSSYSPTNYAAGSGIVEEISKEEAVKILTDKFKGEAKKKNYNNVTIYSSNLLPVGYTSLYEYKDRFFYTAKNFQTEIEEVHVEEKFAKFQKECEDSKIASRVKELGF